MATDRRKFGAGRIIYTAVWILVWPVLVLWLSGDWLWPEGWIFDVWLLSLCVSVIAYLYVRDPALLEERYKQPGTRGQKSWDRFAVFGLVVGFAAWIVIMPLDARRLGWSPAFPFWIKAIGMAFLALSFILFFRALADNTFASPLVRVQAERSQRVISTGAYGMVRHPMYLAGILMFLGAPLLLGSLYGLLIGVAMLLLLAARIVGEERMLLNELEGYGDYRKKVKYRLIPFIW